MVAELLGKQSLSGLEISRDVYWGCFLLISINMCQEGKEVAPGRRIWGFCAVILVVG